MHVLRRTVLCGDSSLCVIFPLGNEKNDYFQSIIAFFVDTLATWQGIRGLTGVHTYPPNSLTTTIRSTICIGETIIS
jgi:hypothetical protein